MGNTNQCPSIYQGIFSNPFFAEQFILIIYSLIFIIGLVGNIMTIIIIKYNTHLRTPTNIYLLNLAVSDLMMLMCNLPLEMIEIYHGEWPLSIVFCKLRNICAEFFTCSSILTILAFTCERYFAIVHPVHFHRLSHFRRAQNVIIIIWLISLGFSLPLGLSYEIETNSFIPINNPSTLGFSRNNNTKFIRTIYTKKPLSKSCKSCVSKKSVAKLLSIIIIITSFAFFYFPMIIIGAIYLFIAKTLRHVSKYEVYSNQNELSISSQLSLSNKEVVEMHQRGSHINSYSWLKMRARYQARQVVVKTLVAVVIAFFVCYAPLYFQRLLLAIITLNSNYNIESSLFSYFIAYLYVISGITFYFGSVINPILYNVVSNKYRRAFRDLLCCRFPHKRKSNKKINQQLFQAKIRSPKQPIHYYPKQHNLIEEKNGRKSMKLSHKTNLQITYIIKKPVLTNNYLSKSNASLINSLERTKRLNPYQ